jgi:hypothetical protein
MKVTFYSLFASQVYSQCNYDAGTPNYSYKTGDYPYLMGSDDYICDGLGLIPGYSENEIGFTGTC